MADGKSCKLCNDTYLNCSVCDNQVCITCNNGYYIDSLDPTKCDKW
jgi:hypothetical protein